MQKQDMPIGFAMEMIGQRDAMRIFSELPETEQQKYIEGARGMHSREEMHAYVKNMVEN